MRIEFLAFVVLFLCAPKVLQGQYDPMVTSGKYWIYLNYYLSADEDLLPVSGHAISFQGDTIINSISYNKVYKHILKGGHPCMYPPCWQFTFPYQTESKSLISFIREDTLTKKVYNLPISPFGFCDTTEHLIFDFSLSIGDTVNSCIYDYIHASSITETLGGIVDSIGVLEVFGKTRNTIFTTGFDNGGHGGQDPAVTRISIVEGVGLEWNGLFFDPLSPLVDFCEDETGFCMLLVSNPPVERTKELNLFPNPATHLVQISAEDEELKGIRIYTMLGIFKAEFLNTNTVDLSNLVEGVYLFEITFANGKRIVKRIIKEN
jgi:hypothetical protein